MILSDKLKNDLAYQKELIELRGYVINKAIATETLLDIIIVNYYVEDKNLRNNFHSNVNSKMSFYQKRLTVQGIVDALGFNIKLDYSKTFKYLEDIGSFRNTIAHWQWQMISDEAEILLAKNELKKLMITTKDVEDFASKCKYVNSKLSPIYFKHIMKI